MTSRNEKELEKLRTQSDEIAEKLAIYTEGFKNLFKELKKNELARVALAIIEYPVEPEKKLASQVELSAAQLGINLKNLQFNLYVTNGAIDQLEEKVEKANKRKEKKND